MDMSFYFYFGLVFVVVWIAGSAAAILTHHFVSEQNEDGLVEFFEAVVNATGMAPKKVVGWIIKDILGYLKQYNLEVKER